MRITAPLPIFIACPWTEHTSCCSRYARARGMIRLEPAQKPDVGVSGRHRAKYRMDLREGEERYAQSRQSQMV